MKKILLVLICILFTSGCSSNNDENILNVLNWSSYIPTSVISDFEKETGIKVNYSTYSSNEELLAKLSSSKEGTYDLVFPSDYMVELMIQKDMLEKIDISKIDNFDNINPIFLNQPYDRNNEYSLPFLAATTVIAYNKKNIKEDISSLNDLTNPKYKNDIVLIDDQRIIIGLGLIANNFDFNSTNKEELDIAKKWLISIKDNIKAYDSDSPKTLLITNETNVGVIWNAEAIIAQAEIPDIKIVYPKEGHAISVDNYVIVKGANHKDNAYKFINYLLTKDVSAKITEEYPYINTTISAINVPYSELFSIFQNGTYVKNIGKYISMYDKVWAEIK